jgi:hypothetical protein
MERFFSERRGTLRESRETESRADWDNEMQVGYRGDYMPSGRFVRRTEN